MADDWLPIGSVGFALRQQSSAEGPRVAYQQLFSDLAAGVREAVGISPSGTVEPVPRHLFAFAEPGEGLEWADRDPFIKYQGEIVVDFRCSALGSWDPRRWKGWEDHGGYWVLYSDVRVSGRLASSPAAPAQKPDYGQARPALRVAMAKYEEELLAISTQDGKAKFLAEKVGCGKSTAIGFLQDLNKK